MRSRSTYTCHSKFRRQLWLKMDFTINDYDLRSAFATERKLLLLAGLYPQPDGKYTKSYLVSACFTLIVSYGQLLTMIVQLGVDRNNLSKLIATLVYFSTHSTFLYKLYSFQIRFSNLRKIEDFLKDSSFYHISFSQMQITKNKIKTCNVIGNGYRFWVTATCTFYCMVPYIDESMKGILPLPGWFPYDTRKYYIPTYIFQVISIAMSAYCNTAIDILTWKMVTLAAAQFEILKENLTNINFEKSGDTKETLVKSVVHHRKIVTLTKQVQELFSRGMFLQLFCSCMVICTTGFQLVIIPMQSIQFVFSAFYLCGMTFQIACYCWYGHSVMTTSDEICQHLYLSNWYTSDLRIRKILLTFMENIKKPTTVKAGNFVTLSLATLTQILRSAYSYFAVLQRLYNKDE